MSREQKIIRIYISKQSEWQAPDGWEVKTISPVYGCGGEAFVLMEKIEEIVK
jgi:hypothetical protein